MTPDDVADYNSWREKLRLDPDLSVDAYLHHLQCELALEEKLEKENE